MSETIKALGTIKKVLGNNNYQVEVQIGESHKEILCHLSGKMRQFKIGVLADDDVIVEIPPPFDKGRIIFRGHKENHSINSSSSKKGKKNKRK